MNTSNSASKPHENPETSNNHLKHLREQIRNDIELYGDEIIDSEEMQQAFEQIHHLRSTVGDHTMRVTASSLRLCYILKKLRVNVDIPAVVIASLCHDLGMLGRDEKYSSDKECYREHPKDSVTVARELVSEMPEKTEDIIERHMWPMGPTEAPNSVEGLVVSVADKYNAVKDLVKGGDVSRAGVRHFISDKYRKIRKTIRSRKADL